MGTPYAIRHTPYFLTHLVVACTVFSVFLRWHCIHSGQSILTCEDTITSGKQWAKVGSIMADCEGKKGQEADAGGKTATAEERVQALLEYCNDKDWNDSMESFFNENCAVFEGYEKGGEYSLQQTGVYQEFLDLFDSKLSEYMKQSGYTRREIFSDFRQVESENPNSFTATAIQFVLAVVEFEVFAELMLDSYKTMQSKAGTGSKTQEQ